MHCWSWVCIKAEEIEDQQQILRFEYVVQFVQSRLYTYRISSTSSFVSFWPRVLRSLAVVCLRSADKCCGRVFTPCPTLYL